MIFQQVNIASCNECMLYLTEDKYLLIEDPQHSKYKILELIERENLKWPSDIVLDAVVFGTWKIFRNIEQSSMLLTEFANGSPRKTLVDLSIKWLEDAQFEHWRNQCHNCKLFGWDYLKKIITITSNCIIANKVKNFNSIIVSQTREKQNFRKLKKVTHPELIQPCRGPLLILSTY